MAELNHQPLVPVSCDSTDGEIRRIRRVQRLIVYSITLILQFHEEIMRQATILLKSAVLRANLAAIGFCLLCVPAAVSHADTVTLKSGAVIEGSVMKRNDRSVWIDIGPRVVELAVEDIEDVLIEDEEEIEVIQDDETMYYTAENLPELSPKEQAKRIGPAVIKVATPRGLGSGVIINPEGYAITNAHVIQGETVIRATVWLPQADGTLLRETIEDIRIVAINNHMDLALLEIEHPEDDSFTFAPLERKEDIEIGQPVFAIGNPLGLERTLSQGVISTKRRSFDGISYIQTDAAINPGNSGGPLFNTRGEVVGITNMGISKMVAESLGFAIPARYVKDFIHNREAFAYDKNNPNSGYNYQSAPPRTKFGEAPMLKDKGGEAG